MSNPASRTPTVVAALAVSAGVAISTLSPLAAGAAPAAPQLSIAVANQKETTTGGASLDYTVTVTNLGGKAVKDLVVSQTVPVGATLDKTDGKGKATSDAGSVEWTLDLPAAGTKTFHTSMTLSKTMPDELLRLATVACAKSSPKAAALVCASDSDQLPAGAAAEEAKKAMESPTKPVVWFYAAAAAALVGAGFVVRALTRRGRAVQPGQGGPTS